MLRKIIEDTINRNIKETNKIWPLHKALPVLFTFGALGILVMFGSHYLTDKKTKKDFFPQEFNLKLGKGISTGNYMFYKVNDEWYGIQGLINSRICPGDSITKEKDSYEIFVYHPNGFKTKYNYSRTYLKSINQDSKLRRHFRLEADTNQANFDCLDRRIE